MHDADSGAVLARHELETVGHGGERVDGADAGQGFAAVGHGARP
ncbi:hypothetical protein ACWERI_27480 [Streptomyces collinus]